MERQCVKRYVIGERPARVPDDRNGRLYVDLPAEWPVYNAARPIYGTIEWRGEFVSGIFYAAVDPNGDQAAWMAQRNAELDASEVVWISEDELVKRYADCLRAKFTDKPKVLARVEEMLADPDEDHQKLVVESAILWINRPDEDAW